MDLDPIAVKAESEAQIRATGGQVCVGLPWLERTQPQDRPAVCDRALAMHATLQLAFGAPKPVIRSWLQTNELTMSLCKRERQVLFSDAELSEQERTNFHWYIEALWAFAWAGTLIPALDVTEPVSDDLASFLPDLRTNEPAAAFKSRFRLRPFSEVYRMLDFYYRAHWYARDGHLNSYDTSPFDLDIIMERRKALEWISDRTISDWDDAPDHT